MVIFKRVNMNNKLKEPVNIENQNGVVLVVSLIFLAALTAVAAALMQNSTMDMKMSGATEEKSVALQEAFSGVDEVIYNQVTALNSRFTRPVAGEDNFPIETEDLLPATLTGSTAVVDTVRNGYNLDVGCPRMQKGNSEGTYGCSLLRITVNRSYGRNGLSSISVATGIAQQIPK